MLNNVNTYLCQSGWCPIGSWLGARFSRPKPLPSFLLSTLPVRRWSGSAILIPRPMRPRARAIGHPALLRSAIVLYGAELKQSRAGARSFMGLPPHTPTQRRNQSRAGARSFMGLPPHTPTRRRNQSRAGARSFMGLPPHTPPESRITLSRPRNRFGLASCPLAPARFRRARSRCRPRLRYSSPPAPPTGRASAGAPFASRCASLPLRSPFALRRGLLRAPCSLRLAGESGCALRGAPFLSAGALIRSGGGLRLRPVGAHSARGRYAPPSAL